jgi:hypothetical protein
MINSNIMQAVGEALEAHQITARPNEQMADTVARALHISEIDANRWLEALNDGCTVAEANRRVGILSHKDNEPLLNTLARLIGKALGSIVPRSGPVE